MAKQGVDPIQRQLSLRWLKDTGSKTKVEALLKIDPELKTFVDEQLVAGIGTRRIAKELKQMMTDDGLEDWKIPSETSILHYKKHSFLHSEYCEGVTIQNNPQLKEMYNMVEKKIDVTLMLYNVMIDLFFLINKSWEKEMAIGMPINSVTKARDTLLKMIVAFNKITKNPPVIINKQVNNNVFVNTEQIKKELDDLEFQIAMENWKKGLLLNRPTQI